MTLIRSILEAIVPNLSDNQKGLLISIHSSATPQQAFEAANGTMMTLAAKDQMIGMGLLIQQQNELKLTAAGNEALISNNLTDETGTITEEGKSQLDHYEQSKTEQINTESFDLFRSFYQ